MADDKQSKGGDAEAASRQDAIVANVMSDPARQQPAAVLTGFLGDSDESGRSRLYLTPQFDQYVEFDAEDALHSQPLTTDESGLGGSAVWLKAGARVRLARTVSHEVQAEFLQGGITAGFMPSAAFSGMPTGAAATGYACTRNYVCSTNPHIPACQMQSDVCGSAFCGPNTGALCPTGAFIC